jgi:hypothetical protein
MKVLDLETKSYHTVVSIDYDTNTIVMESPEYGRTKNTLDKVRLIHDTSEDIKGKTIINPRWFWVIPFVGWFMIPYKLFTIDYCVIESKSLKDQFIMFAVAFGPILLLTLVMYLSI